MTTRLITPPTGLAVSLAEAQLAFRADVDPGGVSALDVEIVRAIRTYITEAEGETSRAIMQQTWRLTLDAFPDAIQLCKPPLVKVDHVKYYDANGVLQLLDPQDYQVDGESEPGYIVPAPGKAWPPTAGRVNAVQVQFQCGYGPDHTSVPDAVSGFVIARLQEHVESNGQPKNEHVLRLLWDLKVYQ